MVEATFTSAMLAVLRSMQGERLVSLECENLNGNNTTYGNLLITTESQRIELINEEEPTEYFGEMEDISRFSCRRLAANEPFRQFVAGEQPRKYPLLGAVTSVSIVNDTITFPNKDYSIRLVMAVILNTSAGQISFLRGWQFDEQITVVMNKDYRKLLRPVHQIREDWAEDEDEITVSRDVITL
ncbi:hypothetical protein CS006_00490 [Bifidobacterium primatium]|uniref:Uncharacterized protein n=1 Tax=Bifidobacterium primatium TaxID=2045438 RepID=A0A2M9HA69_9BIFI|nr:hypothetical protein [Bifidobacterium primatium]PJM73710.1 hypothetical protein CS006_00490 [Bifidobacterium primatium]